MLGAFCKDLSIFFHKAIKTLIDRQPEKSIAEIGNRRSRFFLLEGKEHTYRQLAADTLFRTALTIGSLSL